MIDFRYHLVSLVSVFLALAIGVVLGAGPLRGALADTLNSQVAALREDKANLQQAVNNRDALIAGQNTAITQLGTGAVSGSLPGRSIAVVVLPGASIGSLTDFPDLVAASGAKVGTTVNVTSTWSDPRGAAATARTSALQTLNPQLANLKSGTTPEDQLSALLSRAIVGQAGTLDQTSEAIFTELQDQKLITVSQKGVATDLVLVLAPAPADSPAGDDTKWVQAQSKADLSLTSILDNSAAVVLAGPTAAAADKDGAIAVVRAANTTVSTVDNTGTELGSVSILLALTQQSTGGTGHYGSSDGASTVLPQVGAGSNATPSPSATP